MDVKKIPVVLQFKLTQLTPAQMKKEIKKVEDRIKKYQEEGKNEEEINKEIGSIDKLAAQILIDNGVEGVELPKEKLVDNLADISDVKLAEGQVPERHGMMDGLFTAEELEEQKQKEKERAERDARLKAMREGPKPSIEEPEEPKPYNAHMNPIVSPKAAAPAAPAEDINPIASRISADNPYGLSNRLQEALDEQDTPSFGRNAGGSSRKERPVKEKRVKEPRAPREKKVREPREKREKAPRVKKEKVKKPKKAKASGNRFGGGRLPTFEKSAKFDSLADYDGPVVETKAKPAFQVLNDDKPVKQKKVKAPREKRERAPKPQRAPKVKRERRSFSMPSIPLPRLPRVSLPSFNFSKEEGESLVLAVLGWIFIGSWSAPVYMALHALVKIVPFSLVYVYVFMLVTGIEPFSSQGVTIQMFALGVSFIGPTLLIMLSKPFYQFTYGIITLTNKGANSDIWFEEKENPFDFVKDYPKVYGSLIVIGLIGAIYWLIQFNSTYEGSFTKLFNL